MKKYPNLSKTCTIRGVTYRNRIFSTPTGLTYPDEYSGAPDFRTVLFYEKKARGGAASVNYGETPVNNVDAVRRPNVDVIRPDFSRMILPAKDWIKFTDAIHRHGANPCVQLAHAGLFAEPFFNGASARRPEKSSARWRWTRKTAHMSRQWMKKIWPALRVILPRQLSAQSSQDSIRSWCSAVTDGSLPSSCPLPGIQEQTNTAAPLRTVPSSRSRSSEQSEKKSVPASSFRSASAATSIRKMAGLLTTASLSAR